MTQQESKEMVESETFQKVDPKEFELPDTLFIRDIENRVFQSIILQCLSKIEGISLLEGGFFEALLGRDRSTAVKGITAEQSSKNQSVNVKIEVNIDYGIPIPVKAEEIQTKITEEITHLTGLHVASVHAIFKSVTLPPPPVPLVEEPKVIEEKSVKEKVLEEEVEEEEEEDLFVGDQLDEEFNNEFATAKK